jgi:hypothetical protein
MSPLNSASPGASATGLPISRVMIAPSSSWRSANRSATRRTISARSSMLVAPQVAAALCAASRAALISASVA